MTKKTAALEINLGYTLMLFAVNLCLSYGAPAVAQTMQQIPLKERRISMRVQQKPFPEILVELSRKHQIPIGFQVSDSKESDGCNKPLDISFQEAGIVQVMNSLASICTAYSWEISDEVVNVFPIVKHKSVLDAIIPRIIVSDQTSDEILGHLFDIKEVKRELQSSGLRWDTTTSSLQGGAKNPPKHSFSQLNKSLKDIMNYIVSHTENRFWIYYILSDDKCAFSLRVF